MANSKNNTKRSTRKPAGPHIYSVLEEVYRAAAMAARRHGRELDTLEICLSPELGKPFAKRLTEYQIDKGAGRLLLC